jgi:UDP-N-acetylmuramate: L-alanyl-gamma-D-glutamyl-meso-diaminopimelate ligase
LAGAGLLPDTIGWDADRITADLDVVILGMHARPENPELARAVALGLSVQSYPEFLYNATADKHRIVIGGSHGKTTITSMVLHVMRSLGKPSDFMVGAQLPGFDRMVSLNADHDLVVLEGDEYLSSPVDRRSKFHWYKPQTTLISGIAWDHINVFPTEADYVATFEEYLMTCAENATVVYCADDPVLNQILSSSPRRDFHLIPYSTPTFEDTEGGTTVTFPDGRSCLTPLKGSHNYQNLAGARALCSSLGISPEDFDAAITSFTGASRRLEVLLDDSKNNFTVYRDFAHAPSKVRATTRGIRDSYPNRRIIAAFELHTFSSLNPEFLPTYKGTLDAAHEAWVYFDPAVLEHKGLPALPPEAIQSAFDNPSLRVFTDSAKLKEALEAESKENAVILLMSSGWFSGIQWPAS